MPRHPVSLRRLSALRPEHFVTPAYIQPRCAGNVELGILETSASNFSGGDGSRACREPVQTRLHITRDDRAGRIREELDFLAGCYFKTWIRELGKIGLGDDVGTRYKQREGNVLVKA